MPSRSPPSLREVMSTTTRPISMVTICRTSHLELRIQKAGTASGPAVPVVAVKGDLELAEEVQVVAKDPVVAVVPVIVAEVGEGPAAALKASDRPAQPEGVRFFSLWALIPTKMNPTRTASTKLLA